MGNEHNMTFGIYSRKSKWTGKGESIDNQIQLCKEYIENKFDGVEQKTYRIYEDEGFSGKNTTRPEFQRMLADIRSRKLDCIVCYRLDRISRSVGDFAKTIEEFEHYRIDFVCIKEQFDTSTSMGKAMMNIAAVFAQLERETIAERIRDNMLMLARTGRWLGGVTPLGFQSKQVEKVLDDGKMRVSYKLSPINEEIELVKRIFDKFLEYESVTAVETYLLKQGTKTRNDKNFVAMSIKDILSNPVYCVADHRAHDYFVKNRCVMGSEKEEFDACHGISAYNRTSNEGKYQTRRPMQEWIIAVGKHRGIVSGVNWIRAQGILCKNRMYRFAYNPRNKTSLLSGLLYCKNCGATMRPRINSNSKPDEFGFKSFYYMCELKRKSNKEKCVSENLPGNLLDQRVWMEVMEGYDALGSGLQNKLTELKTQILSETSSIQKQIAVTQGRIREREKEMGGLIRLLAKDADNTVLYSQMRVQADKLAGEIQNLKDHLFQLQEECAKTEEIDPQATTGICAMESLAAAYAQASASDKRALLHTVVDRIEWDRKKVDVFMSANRK